jgi:nitroimidazol reductase NimA-like FMN-containing flavoprotein (pyridoxamine 5'-phosphate oxidase superfamily)
MNIQESASLLQRMAVGRLAIVTEEGPYVVAVNYLYHEGDIYFHSGLSGRKIAALRDDSRVCFLVDEVGPQVMWKDSCGISQIFKSVMCLGKAEFIESVHEKRVILENMLQKYVPSRYPSVPMDDGTIETTAIVKIVIESISGKKNELSPSHTVLKNGFDR